MPDMVTIEVDPSFKPTPDLKEQFEIAKRIGPKEVSDATAQEALRNSNGMYRIKETAPEVMEMPVVRLEDKPLEELKLMMLQLGVKTEKQMKKSDVVALIQRKLDEVEIVDDAE